MKGTLDRLLLSAVLAVGISVVFLRRDRAVTRVREFFTAASHPANLAVFRIVLFAAVLLRVWESDPVGRARDVDAIPTALMYPPQVLGWFVPELPLTDTAITVAGWALVGGAVAALVGLFARSAALVCAVAMTYLMAAPNYFGKVDHDHHHLIWFALVLAAAPAADALSLGRLARVAAARRRGEHLPSPGPAVRYGLPLRLTWLTLGSLYLFTGLGKVAVGLDWVASDNLRNFLWLHWQQAGWVPSIRVDRWDVALTAAAATTVILETGFLFAMFLPRARRVFAVFGFGLHLAIRWLLRITHFWTLQVAYVTFVDWHELVGRRRRVAATVEPAPAPSASGKAGKGTRLVAVGGGLVVAAVFLVGAAGLEGGWPVSQYPPFGYLPAPENSQLSLEVQFSDGRTETLEPSATFAALGPARYRALALRSLSEHDTAGRERRLRALWSVTAATRTIEAVTEIRVYSLERTTDPDRRAEATVAQRLVAVFAPGIG